MVTFTATYSPEDNKLRIYASARLDPETYQRVKAAGYSWAPKQDLFVAPMWTPERADLATELAGEIGDEDRSLVERAEDRADRFEEYSDKRAHDAERAHAAVASIADNIPMGQPILVGHHSERRARKDAERITNGMRKAVKMWETSTYWTARAAGALHHAKYKEIPAVRARRIKGLEADLRKAERDQKDAERHLALWNTVDTPEKFRKNGEIPTREELARYIAGGDGHLTVIRLEGQSWTAYDVLRPDGERYKACPAMTVDDVLVAARAAYPRAIAHAQRWIDHISNRLAYERAMLAESGFTPPPKKKSKAELPLLNYGGEVSYRNPYGFGNDQRIVTDAAVGLTKAELAKIPSDYKGTRIAEDGTHRVRTALAACIPSLRGTFGGDDNKRHSYRIVWVTDSKVHAKPGAEVVAEVAGKEEAAKEAMGEALLAAAVERAKRPRKAADPRVAKIAELKDALKAGVTVVAAPQLFPTPVDVARRMVELAEVRPGQRVLEPSAGTGRLVDALDAVPGAHVVAVEINATLADTLRLRSCTKHDVRCADFLACNGDLGQFDRILMNPPFKDGADVKHIGHAFHMLAPGGRLVAICANGPRQQAALKPIAKEWIDLPDGTFAEEGTNVRTAMVVIERDA